MFSLLTDPQTDCEYSLISLSDVVRMERAKFVSARKTPRIGARGDFRGRSRDLRARLTERREMLLSQTDKPYSLAYL